MTGVNSCVVYIANSTHQGSLISSLLACGLEVVVSVQVQLDSPPIGRFVSIGEAPLFFQPSVLSIISYVDIPRTVRHHVRLHPAYRTHSWFRLADNVHPYVNVTDCSIRWELMPVFEQLTHWPALSLREQVCLKAGTLANSKIFDYAGDGDESFHPFASELSRISMKLTCAGGQSFLAINDLHGCATLCASTTVGMQ